MEYKEYEEIRKQWAYAGNSLDDALHHIYEACYHLRQVRSSEADRIEEMMGGIKLMLESWKETVEDAQGDWESENYDKKWEDEE